MSRKKLDKIYKIMPILALVILIICFIFRYSYINILGFTRPLILASVVCAGLGLVGTIFALIDGINKNFQSGTLKFFIINLIFIFTFPILYSLETFVVPKYDPFEGVVPETTYSTDKRDDSAFILEGKLYEWPLTFDEFISNGYDYRELGNGTVSISKYGDSVAKKPTWFTDGVGTKVAVEQYNVELHLLGDGPIESRVVDEIKIKSLYNNWDFEIQGFTLLESKDKILAKYKDQIKEDPDNKNKSMKLYYLETSDGNIVTFGLFQGKLQMITIKRPSK